MVGDSRNLSKLAAVVEILEILLRMASLDRDSQLSRGPALALNLALMAVDEKLQKPGRGYLRSIHNAWR